MKMTQELLDFLKACTDGNETGRKLGLVGLDRDVVYKGLVQSGHQKYADWIMSATSTLEAVRFSGGIPSGRFATTNEEGNELLSFDSKILAEEFIAKKQTNIFLQNKELWFSMILEEPIANSNDCRWIKLNDLESRVDGDRIQIFNMFLGRHTLFTTIKEARDYRDKIIFQRMISFRSPLFKEFRNEDGDSALEFLLDQKIINDLNPLT